MAPKQSESSGKLSTKKVQSRGKLSPNKVKFAVENEEVVQEVEQEEELEEEHGEEHEVEQKVQVTVDLSAMTVVELRRRMEVRGIPLPKARVKKANLVELLKEAGRTKEERDERKGVKNIKKRKLGSPREEQEEGAGLGGRKREKEEKAKVEQAMVWLVEVQEDRGEGGLATSATLAFTSKEAAVDSAEAAFLNLSCFYDLLEARQLPPVHRPTRGGGVVLEARVEGGAGGRVEVRGVVLDQACRATPARVDKVREAGAWDWQ